jgi:hypothetical protein
VTDPLAKMAGQQTGVGGKATDIAVVPVASVGLGAVHDPLRLIAVTGLVRQHTEDPESTVQGAVDDLIIDLQSGPPVAANAGPIGEAFAEPEVDAQPAGFRLVQGRHLQ